MCNPTNLNNLKASTFYTLIRGVDTVEPFILNLIGEMESRYDNRLDMIIHFHYTDNANGSGDLRIRKHAEGNERNAVTIDYQTQNQRLLVRHLLSNVSFKPFSRTGLERRQGGQILNQETFIDLNFMRNQQDVAFDFIDRAIVRQLMQ